MDAAGGTQRLAGVDLEPHQVQNPEHHKNTDEYGQPAGHHGVTGFTTGRTRLRTYQVSAQEAPSPTALVMMLMVALSRVAQPRPTATTITARASSASAAGSGVRGGSAGSVMAIPFPIA